MKKGKRTFLYLIIPYACILVILVSMWSFSNIFTIKKNKEKILSIMTSTLSNNVSSIENGFTSVENSVYSIAQNPSLYQFFKTSDVNYTDMIKFQETLASYNVENPIIKNIYIYNRKADILLDQSDIYSKSLDFFHTKCTYLKTDPGNWFNMMSEGKWKNGYASSQEVLYNQTHGEIITYTRTVPISNNKKNYGNITALIDKKQLFSLYNNLFPDVVGEFHIFNNKGEQIASTGDYYIDSVNSDSSEQFVLEEEKINGEDFFKFNFTSSRNNWKYVILMRQDDVLKEAYQINTVLNIISAISFLLGCALCIYFAYGRNKSYVEILNMFGIEKKWNPLKSNEFSVIQSHTTDLVNENKKIKTDLSKISLSESEKILHMLFSGKFETEEGAKEWISRSKIDLTEKEFIVVDIFANNFNTNIDASFKLFFENTVKEFINNQVYFYYTDTRHIGVLLPFNKDGDFLKKLKHMLIRLHIEFSYKHGIPILIGVGNPRNELCQVKDSFAEAKQVVEYSRMIDEKQFFFYTELPKDNMAYYYPIEKEKKLRDLTITGNFEGAKEVLDEIYIENFKKRVLNYSKINELLREIYSTLTKINSVYMNEEETLCSIDNFSVSQFFEYASAFLNSVSANINKSKQTEMNDLIVELLQYVKENYMNSQLSLTTLSERFDLKDTTYISKLFKKHTGENFSVYLENLRIEKACELLQSDKYSVKEIAYMVGYLSAISFRRAFKKKTAVNPTEYKNIHH